MELQYESSALEQSPTAKERQTIRETPKFGKLTTKKPGMAGLF
jgi:hypothetical protein